MFPVTITDFAEWLEKELIEQKVTQAELSRRSGISPSQISKILNMQSSPGPEACTAIARALDLPEEEVFRHAELLSPKTEDAPNLAEWVHLFLSADPAERDRMLELARVLSRRSRNKK
ncbi:MAG TPA: helix-turn-helix transcriptional regulator [Thermoguttaceae bacterium]